MKRALTSRLAAANPFDIRLSLERLDEREYLPHSSFVGGTGFCGETISTPQSSPHWAE
jgi:hypothetical protein